MQTWVFIDRSGWNNGPWNDEPIDKAVWKDPTTGLDCMIHRGPLGSWCGYVGVGKSHKFFGDEYNDHDNLNVHGGLTFSSGCSGMEDNGRGICHPTDDEDHVWWFGFDTAHGCDTTPDGGFGFLSRETSTYRDKKYVMDEVTDLAKQLTNTDQ